MLNDLYVPLLAEGAAQLYLSSSDILTKSLTPFFSTLHELSEKISGAP